MKAQELNEKDLAEVSGGTFTPNTYTEDGYHEYGISTSYSFFEKDKFMYMGKPIDYDTANKIMKLGNLVKSSINGGFDNKNRIGSNEAAFIRAFNLQLALTFGPDFVWDGKPGKSF